MEAHRVVLAACSPYFCAMFTGTLQQTLLWGTLNGLGGGTRLWGACRISLTGRLLWGLACRGWFFIPQQILGSWNHTLLTSGTRAVPCCSHQRSCWRWSCSFEAQTSDAYSWSRMFNLTWHLLLLPKITLWFPGSHCALVALLFWGFFCVFFCFFAGCIVTVQCTLVVADATSMWRERGDRILALIPITHGCQWAG